jgi:hypothetical protein
MRNSLEPDPNVTVESLTHSRKQQSGTSLTDAGMKIDESEEHLKKAKGPILTS